MIVKMKKVAFSSDNKRKGKNTGSLTNHILYLITDKKTKRYSDMRCHLSFSLNPNQPDLGALLTHKGGSLSQAQLSELVNSYCLKQHQYVTQHYLKNSRKSNQLDDYQECLDPQKLFNYQGSLSFTQAEYQKLLKASGGNEAQAKSFMENITRHYLASYYNQIKKEQKIKGKKTKPEDIELALNFHIEGEANPHIHFYTHAFCPTTKRYMNPRYFSETKQKVHKQIERQFAQFLEQGVATGQQKNQARTARRKYLSFLLDHCHNWFEVKKVFRDLESLLSEVLGNDDPLHAKIAELQKNGISLKVKPNQHIEILLKDVPITLTVDTFINRRLKQSLKRFAKQYSFEQQSQRYGNTTPVAKMETVLLNNLNAVNKALSKELGQIPPSEHKETKNKAFKTFYERCLVTGVLVNLNKQHHLSFHKLDENKQVNNKNNLKATKYNASLFNSPELSGKAIARHFDLDLVDIHQHQSELMELMPRTVNYRKVVFFSLDNKQRNHVYQEYFHLKRYQSIFDCYGLEVFEEKDKTTVFNRNGESLIQIRQIDENYSRITMNTLHAPSAAKVLHSMLVREAKSLLDDQAIFISPAKYSFGRQHLRYLHLEIMFSTDKHSKRIVVDYNGMSNDKKLQRMIDEKLDQELARFEKNFVRYSQKNPDQYQFGEAVGTHLLDNEHLSPEQRERVKKQIENQKQRLELSTAKTNKNKTEPAPKTKKLKL
ncbi:TPA: hypothetical protein JG825_001970 [Vibrio parahaemolyticus]|uniref:hypothetical protein n=1 Tax=Vibrio harveyi group TaxID=717610 RepID=UPI00111FBB37|nr:hypothetical protein [Vibrio parahaemolyticus]MDG2666248.1 hypothetical protein [Vibrio parahaemolyticus]MEA5295872.1 hypothetical protein [Vibrio parahaemolyticus]TOM22385.1 hypothetical protein CGH81_23665 [Vibrio parahaemolyticus]UPR17945.1 hypothetical protein H9J99_24775 [Vibrio parahaemolyticus]UPR22385.1 hypothetical protein H9J98_21785 [Vibrio parahaemolyticus]